MLKRLIQWIKQLFQRTTTEEQPTPAPIRRKSKEVISQRTAEMYVGTGFREPWAVLPPGYHWCRDRGAIDYLGWLPGMSDTRKWRIQKVPLNPADYR